MFMITTDRSFIVQQGSIIISHCGTLNPRTLSIEKLHKSQTRVNFVPDALLFAHNFWKHYWNPDHSFFSNEDFEKYGYSVDIFAIR